MIAVGRCTTKRVLRLPCPICEQTVEVTVEGLPRGADPQAWLDAQPLEEWDRIHSACEREAAPRTRTRRMTP